MHNTIAAIATAHGVSSISIIRVSGDAALEIAHKISHLENIIPRHAHLTSLYNFNNELIDHAIMIYFAAPHSFTGEEIVEFQCHGGMIVAQEILDTIISHGVRLAEPGEFSKRAFLNGKIDLTEAEAISKLIEAKSVDAAKILAKQMKGELHGCYERFSAVATLPANPAYDAAATEAALAAVKPGPAGVNMSTADAYRKMGLTLTRR